MTEAAYSSCPPSVALNAKSLALRASLGLQDFPSGLTGAVPWYLRIAVRPARVEGLSPSPWILVIGDALHLRHQVETMSATAFPFWGLINGQWFLCATAPLCIPRFTLWISRGKISGN
jgi:hypothetical protein